MIISTSRKAKLLGVAVSLAGITIPVAPALAVSAHAARSYKIDYTVAKGKVPKNLLHQTGKLQGSPFGSATFIGKTEVPITTYVWKFKSGKLDIKFTATLKGVIASGRWKVTGGTGKFAHAHGTGHASGAINGTKQFHFVGTVTL